MPGEYSQIILVAFINEINEERKIDPSAYIHIISVYKCVYFLWMISGSIYLLNFLCGAGHLSLNLNQNLSIKVDSCKTGKSFKELCLSVLSFVGQPYQETRIALVLLHPYFQWSEKKLPQTSNVSYV